MIRADDARELRRLARENFRSTAAEVRVAVRKHLNDQQKDSR